MEVNCKVCRGPVENDGYGELVHQDTGLYGAYTLPQDDPRHGVLGHVAQ